MSGQLSLRWSLVGYHDLGHWLKSDDGFLCLHPSLALHCIFRKKWGQFRKYTVALNIFCSILSYLDRPAVFLLYVFECRDTSPATPSTGDP